MNDLVTEFSLSVKQGENPSEPEIRLEIKGNLDSGTLRELVADARRTFDSILNRRPPRLEAPLDEEIKIQLEEALEDGEPGDVPFNPKFFGDVTLNNNRVIFDEKENLMVQNAINFNGFVKVLGRSNDYTVFFPPLNWNGFDDPLVVLEDSEVAPSSWMSWPVCSCPAYYFGNFSKGTVKQGSCRHIEACLPGNEFDWRHESHDARKYANLCKNEGIPGFEWVSE